MRKVFLMLLLLPLSAILHGQNGYGVYFNEVRPDDAGADNVEFIELVGVTGVSLTGWYIIHYNGDAASDGGIWTHTIGTFSFPNDGITDVDGNSVGFYLLQQNAAALAGADESLLSTKTLQNGPDGLILYDNNNFIVDAIAWGDAGDMNTDDPGTVSTAVASSSETYLMVTPYDDTGDNGVSCDNNVFDGAPGTPGNWLVVTATPGAINSGQTTGLIDLGLADPIADCTELFISEYVEGSSDNKAIEIYNPTGSAINLSGYSLVKYTNGSPTVSNTYNFPSVSLASGDVYVVAHTNSNASILAKADATNGGALDFNGNDIIGLRKGTLLLDVIGRIGEDPGTAWTGGGCSTADRTLTRKVTVEAGDNIGNNPFDPSTQWNCSAINDDTNLGTHSSNCLASPCAISDLDAGSQTACVIATNTYTQQVIVTYTSAPGSGTLNVNGQSFSITGSPQTVTLTGLVANGSPVNVTAVFSADLACTRTENSLFTAPAPCTAPIADCSAIFFSEYVEGSSSNKCLEIYNPTSSSVNLTGVSILFYSNGSATATVTINLSGTLQSFETYVVCDDDAAAAFRARADFLSPQANFYNGNDAIELRRGATVYDIIGRIGEDPGTAWSGGGVSTANQSLIRDAIVKAGDNSGVDAFNPDVQWSSNGLDIASYLGYHLNTCGPCVWNGSQGTAWATAANWDCGIQPTAADDVIIPDVSNASGNSPVISVSGEVCRDLEIRSGASLTINSGLALDVKGDVSVANGTNLGAGGLTLSGTSAQTMSGDLTTSTLDIANSSGVSLTAGADISISGFLDLSSGVFTRGSGSVTLVSTAAGTAYLDNHTGGGSLSGNIIVQMFVRNGTAKDQHLISSPVSAPNVNQLQDDLSGPYSSGLTGANGVAVTPDMPVAGCDLTQLAAGSNYGNLFEWQESRVTPANDCELNGWVVRSSGSLQDGRGYSAYLQFGNTADWEGTPSEGNKIIGVTRTNSLNTAADGWNILGNPYPQPMSRNAVLAGNGNLSSLTYFDVNSGFQGTYQPYPNGSNIAINQGFAAQTASSGNVTFTDAMRTTGSASWYRQSDWFDAKLEVMVEGNSFRDITYLYFNPEATDEFDRMYDCLKRSSRPGQPTLYSIGSDGQALSMNALATDNIEDARFPLGITTGDPGAFTFSVSGMESLSDDIEAFFADRLTGETISLRDQAEFTYELGAEEIRNRFEIVFERAEEQVTSTMDEVTEAFLYYSDGTLLIDWKGPHVKAQIIVINSMGQSVHTSDREITAGNEVKIPLGAGLASGIYLVNIRTEKAQYIQNFFLQ